MLQVTAAQQEASTPKRSKEVEEPSTSFLVRIMMPKKRLSKPLPPKKRNVLRESFSIDPYLLSLTNTAMAKEKKMERFFRPKGRYTHKKPSITIRC